jgi:hypothetical protein
MSRKMNFQIVARMSLVENVLVIVSSEHIGLALYCENDQKKRIG